MQIQHDLLDPAAGTRQQLAHVSLTDGRTVNGGCAHGHQAGNAIKCSLSMRDSRSIERVETCDSVRGHRGSRRRRGCCFSFDNGLVNSHARRARTSPPPEDAAFHHDDDGVARGIVRGERGKPGGVIDESPPGIMTCAVPVLPQTRMPVTAAFRPVPSKRSGSR